MVTSDEHVDMGSTAMARAFTLIFAEDELSGLIQKPLPSSGHSSTVYISCTFFSTAGQIRASLWQCGVISAAKPKKWSSVSRTYEPSAVK